MKRYDHFCSYDGGGPADAEESPDGEFVRYDDASAEIARLRADLDAALMIVIDLGGEVRTPEFDEAVALRKDAERYRLLRMDREGEALPDVAMYSGRALDDYIDDAARKPPITSSQPPL